MKHGAVSRLLMRYAGYFILPAFVLFWVFFAVLEVMQIKAFAKGRTPCPKWCWVFFLPVGMAAAMLAGVFGNLWMFLGLLLALGRK